VIIMPEGLSQFDFEGFDYTLGYRAFFDLNQAERSGRVWVTCVGDSEVRAEATVQAKENMQLKHYSQMLLEFELVKGICTYLNAGGSLAEVKSLLGVFSRLVTEAWSPVDADDVRLMFPGWWLVDVAVSEDGESDEYRFVSDDLTQGCTWTTDVCVDTYPVTVEDAFDYAYDTFANGRQGLADNAEAGRADQSILGVGWRDG